MDRPFKRRCRIRPSIPGMLVELRAKNNKPEIVELEIYLEERYCIHKLRKNVYKPQS